MPNLDLAKLSDTPLVLPSAQLLRMYIKFVDPVYRQVEVLIIKHETLRAARDLLPRLMSGEVAV